MFSCCFRSTSEIIEPTPITSVQSRQSERSDVRVRSVYPNTIRTETISPQLAQVEIIPPMDSQRLSFFQFIRLTLAGNRLQHLEAHELNDNNDHIVVQN